MSLVVLFALLSVLPGRVDVAVDPRPGRSFALAFEGPSGAEAGDFRGRLALYGSPAEMPISGKAEKSGERVRVSADVRYDEVPADWLQRFRADFLEFRVAGQVAGARPIEWSGRMPWKEASVTGGDLLSRFVNLGSLELTSLSVKRTEGRVVLNLSNPFSFPVTIAAASCRLRVNGREIGAGAAKGRTAPARKTIGFEMPFRSEEAAFRDAAGPRWAVGASVDASVATTLTIRLPSAEASIPVELSGALGTDGARSGVFSHVQGATSLRP